MKQFAQSLLLGWIALQGLACAGADHSAEGDDEAASFFELAPGDGAAGAAPDLDQAPQGVELLSPAERDAELGALTDPRGNAPDAPSPGELVLQARLLERRVRDVQVSDAQPEARIE